MEAFQRFKENPRERRNSEACGNKNRNEGQKLNRMESCEFEEALIAARESVLCVKSGTNGKHKTTLEETFGKTLSSLDDQFTRAVKYGGEKRVLMLRSFPKMENRLPLHRERALGSSSSLPEKGGLASSFSMSCSMTSCLFRPRCGVFDFGNLVKPSEHDHACFALRSRLLTQGKRYRAEPRDENQTSSAVTVLLLGSRPLRRNDLSLW